MKKIALLIPVIAIVFFACNNENPEDATQTDKPESKMNNALVNQNIIVSHIFSFDPEVRKEWISCLNEKDFLSSVIENVENGKVNVYPYLERNTGAKMNEEERKTVLNKMKSLKSKDSGLEDVVNNIFFEEEWILDTVEFKMKKAIQGYGLVNVQYKEDDSLKTRPVRDMLFFVKPESKKFDKEKYELIAENIKYEFNVFENEAWTSDLDNEKFANIIYERVKNGQTKAYDFFSEDKKQLSMEEVRHNLLIKTDTIEVTDPETGETFNSVIGGEFMPEIIESYIFLENWYFDKESCSIYKEIKAVAPVVHFFKYNDSGKGEKFKKISFIVYFDNK